MARLYPDPTQSVTYSAADMAGMNTPDQRPSADQGSGITTPPEQNFNTPAMAGSMQQFLADNLGQYVIIEFLVGTQSVTQKAGVLYAVGSSVVTLYEEVSQTFVTCDIFSVKFVTFFLPGRRPWQASQPLFPTSGMWGISQTQQGSMPAAPATGGMPATGSMPVPGAMPAAGGMSAPGGCASGNCAGGY